MNPVVSMEVWGDLACWTRPESKVERLTYPVPTPSGMRGVLSAIYSKPKEFYWQVRRIEVLKPIQYTSFRRNEVKSKMGRGESLCIEDDRTQRQSIMLKDVRYRITAELMPQPQPSTGARPVLHAAQPGPAGAGRLLRPGHRRASH